MKLVLASTNLHKIREIKSMLKDFGVEFDLYSLRDFPNYTPAEETGTTFEENASAKALHAAREIGELVLADDSGLVVPALGGEPGVISARYAGEEATDKDNRVKLIQKLKTLDDHDRNAYFTCSIAIANPDGIQKLVTGYCEGTLIIDPKGSNGFGYDPLFKKYDYSKTLSEIDEETKNKISHRRKAIEKLRFYFEELSCTTS